MRPLRLTLRAFGPFAGEVRVDFARGGDAQFLLINGPTGAGKTSLLDGLCFALYGKASGEAREKQSDRFLRSQQARPEDECVVSLVFEVAGRRFLVERKPTQLVRSRGKDVERKHSAGLWEIDADGAVLGERLGKVTDVNQRVEELIGFTSEQFRQVMVLPQGEFRRLLLAKSDEKEKILRKLFGAGRYRLVEEALKARRNALERQLSELGAGMEAILSAKGAHGVGELEERLAAALARRGEREAGRDALRLAQAEAQAALARGQAVEREFLERAQAGEALDALAARQTEAQAQARRAERAVKALEHADLEAAIAQGERAASGRLAVLARLDQELEELEARRAQAQEALTRAEAARLRVPELAAERERLAAGLARLRERAAAAGRVRQAESGEAAASTAAAKAEQELSALDQRLEELRREAEGLSGLGAEAARLDMEISRLEAQTGQRAQLDELTRKQSRAEAGLAQAQAGHAEAEAALGQARRARQEAQQALLYGRAALLAATLVQGQPCPVCGSTEHPGPAAGAGALPDRAALEKAEAAEARAEKALESARAAVDAARTQAARLESGLAHCRESLGEAAAMPAEELARRLAQARERASTLNAGQERLERCRAAREELAARRPEALARRDAAQAAHAGSAQALAGARALLERLRSEAGAQGADGDAAAVQARLDELARAIPKAEADFRKAQDALNALDTRLGTGRGQRDGLRQGHEQALTLLAGQRQDFERRLLESGFYTRREYEEAKLPRQQAEALQEAAARHGQALAAARDRLDRATAACQDKTRPDMAALNAAQERAAAELDALNRELGELSTQVQDLGEALNAIGEKAARARELEENYRVVGRLADIAAGDNPRRMTLQRYVLAALFEEVARAASQRLGRMSRGRYRLVRSEATRDARSTGGLDLDVVDAHSGEARPASTLSGGESFLASLALALGLSDVVMAQQGGRRLDCIFIDEGFGALDGDTLEDALRTLAELHGAGRLIGVISHVAELKERIDARIDVLPGRPGKGGSTVRQVNC